MTRGRALLVAAAVAAVAFPAVPANAACVGRVCVNAPDCGQVCVDLDRVLGFECSDEAQLACDVRDLIRP